jgi:hypothetical protein
MVNHPVIRPVKSQLSSFRNMHQALPGTGTHNFSLRASTNILWIPLDLETLKCSNIRPEPFHAACRRLQETEPVRFASADSHHSQLFRLLFYSETEPTDPRQWHIRGVQFLVQFSSVHVLNKINGRSVDVRTSRDSHQARDLVYISPFALSLSLYVLASMRFSLPHLTGEIPITSHAPPYSLYAHRLTWCDASVNTFLLALFSS